jgi:hypothetical protein
MKTASRNKTYISEEEFNRLVVNRNDAPPEEDSKGDSANNDYLEAELGEEYPNEDPEVLNEIENEDLGHTKTQSSESDDEMIENGTRDESHDGSTWPDPTNIPA